MPDSSISTPASGSVAPASIGQPYLPDLCRLPVVLAVLLMTQLLVLIYILSLGALTSFDWPALAMHSLYNQWISLLVLAGWCQGRKLVNGRSDKVATLLCIAWVVAAVLLANSGAQWINGGLNLAAWDWQWWLRDTLIYVVLAAIALRYLFVIRLWREEQAAADAAKLDALYARIRPHFLFNSMNTIASLISYAPQEAEESVEDLSLLLRSSMLASERLCLWRDELALCKAYCRIEQQRLGDRLQVNWEVDAVPNEFELPPLILQPLIENAVYHGVEPIPEGGYVNVSANVPADKPARLELVIENPMGEQVSANKSQRQHNGMAIDNIRARLARIYRDPDTLESAAELSFEEVDSRYRVTLVLPMEVASLAAEEKL